MRFQLRVKNWRSYLPILDVARGYRLDDLGHDLVAGLIVGIVTVPQAMAYAYLAGLPPQAGLYACLLPMLIYTLLGSSRHLVVGPVAVAAIMVAAAIGEHAPRHSDAYMGVAIILSLQVGIILWLLRLWQMGGLVNLLSHPVITGFINAAALLIIFSQLPSFMGLQPESFDSPVDQALWLVEHAGETGWLALVIGLGSLAFLLLFPKMLAAVLGRVRVNIGQSNALTRLGPMLLVLISILVVWLTEPAGLRTVGFVPEGMPIWTVPPFDLQLWIDLIPSAAMISVVAYVESYSIGTTLAARELTRLNSHQELIALGAANIGAAFTGAYPVAGSFSRSSVNYDSGARSPISSVFCALVIIGTLLFLTPIFEYLPTAVLAAIVVVSVFSLMDFRSTASHWRIHREDAIAGTLTMATVLVFGVETGLLTGVALSLAFFVRSSSRPNVTPIGRLGDTEHFRSIRRHDVRTVRHVLALRIDENIYFANANQVENKIVKSVQRREGTEHLLLVCSAVNMIDVTGIEMLIRLNRRLQRSGVTLSLAEVKDSVATPLKSADIGDSLTGRIYFTTDQAMRSLEAEGEKLALVEEDLDTAA